MTRAGEPDGVTIDVSTCEEPVSVALETLTTRKVIVSSVLVLSALAVIVYATEVLPAGIVATKVSDAADNVTVPLGPVNV